LHKKKDGCPDPSVRRKQLLAAGCGLTNVPASDVAATAPETVTPDVLAVEGLPLPGAYGRPYEGGIPHASPPRR